jgi:hypothetical protein
MRFKKILLTLILILTILLNTFCYAENIETTEIALDEESSSTSTANEPTIYSDAAILIDSSTRTSAIF